MIPFVPPAAEEEASPQPQTPRREARPSHNRRLPPRPDGMAVRYHGPVTVLAYRRCNPVTAVLSCLTSLGLWAFCYWLWGGADPETEPFPVWPFMAGFALLISYAAASECLNSLVVTIGPDEVRVAQRPLPWPGSRTVQLSELRKTYVRKRRVQDENGSGWVYDVMAARFDGPTVQLCTFNSPECAAYVEAEIDQRG